MEKIDEKKWGVDLAYKYSNKNKTISEFSIASIESVPRFFNLSTNVEYVGGNINIKDAASVGVDGRVYAHGESSKVEIANVGNVSVSSTNGSAINSASNNSTIKIGDAQTVKITGTTQNLSPIKNANGETISYNEDNRAVVYSKGTVNIIATFEEPG